MPNGIPQMSFLFVWDIRGGSLRFLLARGGIPFWILKTLKRNARDFPLESTRDRRESPLESQRVRRKIEGIPFGHNNDLQEKCKDNSFRIILEWGLCLSSPGNAFLLSANWVWGAHPTTPPEEPKALVGSSRIRWDLLDDWEWGHPLGSGIRWTH